VKNAMLYVVLWLMGVPFFLLVILWLLGVGFHS
jgi:hypothetical protein